VKIRPRDGHYYDLIRVPHGHIPVPLIRLWKDLPIPVKDVRTHDYYHCPICGSPSFYKIDYACWDCESEAVYDEYLDRLIERRWQRKRRKEYFRNIWKKLEYLILPFLVLVGKAWYVIS